MATTNGIKFYSKTYAANYDFSQHASDGSVIFDKTTKAIYVGGVKYGGSNIADASFNNNVLTISKVSGNNIQLDFSSLATTKSVMAVFNEIKEQLTMDDAAGTYVAQADESYVSSATLTSVNTTNVIDTTGSDATMVDDAIAMVDKKAKATLNEVISAKKEIDAIETGAGLGSDGTYTADSNAHYINNATSLADADSKLDAAINSIVSGSVTGAKITDGTNEVDIVSNHIATIKTDGTYSTTSGSENLIATESTVSDAIDVLEVGEYAQASISGSTLTIKGIKEEGGLIGASTSSADTTIILDGTYNASTNKIATQSTVSDAIEGLDVNTAIQPVTYTAATSSTGASLTFAGMKETDGKIVVGDGATTLQLAKVATTGNAEDVAYSATIGSTSVTNVDDALDALVSQSGSALQSISHGTDGNYVTTTIGTKTNNDQSVGVAVTTASVSTSGTTDGLAVASDVKSYVDGAINGLDTTNDVAIATADWTTNQTVVLNGSVKEVNGVIADGTASDVTLYFTDEVTSSNKIITQKDIEDLSGAMHFRSVITTSAGTDYVAAINAYYAGQNAPDAEVGDVFVDSTNGKEYVVKSLPSSGNLTSSNIEEFGSVNPDTTVTSLTSGTSTDGLTVTSNSSATGDVTVNVNADSGYQIPTTAQMTKVDDIVVDTSKKSVTDGTNTLTNLVSDANYTHITITSTSVSDGTATFNKYTHPTTTAVAAASKQVGYNELGHVVLGNDLTSANITTVSGDPQSQNGTTISDSLQHLQSQITGITVNNGSLSIGGTSIFTANQSGDTTITMGNGLSFSSTGNTISVGVDSNNANGLSSTSNGLAMAQATDSAFGTVKVTNGNGLSISNGVISMATATNPSGGTATAGAMSAADKTKLDGVSSGAQVNTIEGVQIDGTDITPDSTSKKVNITFSDGTETVVVNDSTATTIASIGGKNITTKVAFYWEEYAQ